MKRLIPLIIILVFCMWTSSEADQIYQWIDKNGVTHFTNEPPPPGAKIVNEQKAIPYNEAADQKNMQEQQEFLDQDSEPDSQQQESQTDQQEESQPDSPAVQTDYSESDDGDAVVHPYVSPRERAREYERRKQEGEEIVTPLPARERVRVRRR
jgi:FtsZ-interacting cell division protein ZipA